MLRVKAPPCALAAPHPRTARYARIVPATLPLGATRPAQPDNVAAAMLCDVNVYGRVEDLVEPHTPARRVPFPEGAADLGAAFVA